MTARPFACALAFLSAGVAFFLLSDEIPWWFPRCQLNQATGLHCPGCGSTRALASLAAGDFAAAIRFNVLLILFLAFCLIEVVGHAFKHTRIVTRIRNLQSPLGRRIPWAKIALFIVLAFSVLRNIPRHPFTLLSPPA